METLTSALQPMESPHLKMMAVQFLEVFLKHVLLQKELTQTTSFLLPCLPFFLLYTCISCPSPSFIFTLHAVASSPTMVSAQQVDPGSCSISVTWSAPSGGAPVTGYTIHYSGGGDTGSVNMGPSTTATNITGCINDGRTYNITVEALSTMISGVSNTISVILSE